MVWGGWTLLTEDNNTVRQWPVAPWSGLGCGVILTEDGMDWSLSLYFVVTNLGLLAGVGSLVSTGQSSYNLK